MTSRRAFLATALTLPLLVGCGAEPPITAAPAGAPTRPPSGTPADRASAAPTPAASVSAAPTPAAALAPVPAAHFDLNQWKLQIPGPKDVTELADYTSQFFYLNDRKQMCFWVDCAAEGTTENSNYVRSELRHLPNWRIADDGTRTLSATMRVDSRADPDKVTVMQIHGTSEDGDNVPPLLRIALNGGTLSAFLKATTDSKSTDSTVLLPLVGLDPFTCTLTVKQRVLTISANNVDVLSQDISYWPYLNYFKAGCYPQSHRGTVNVYFDALNVSV